MKNQVLNKILIVEEPSLAAFAYAALRKNTFKKMYYIYGSKGICLGLLKFLGKGRFEKLRYSDFKGAKSEISANSLNMCDDFIASAGNDSLMTLLKRFAGGEKIVLALEKYFFNSFAYNIAKTLTIIKKIPTEKNEIIVFLPSRLNYGLLAKYKKNIAAMVSIPAVPDFFIKITILLKSFLWPAASYIYILWNILFVRGITFGRRLKKKYSVSMPISFGIADFSVWSDDFIVKSGFIKPQDILFVREEWPVTNRTLDRIKEMGADYVDFNKARPTLFYFAGRVLASYAILCLVVLCFFLLNPGKRALLVKGALLVAAGLLFNEIFFLNYDVKVYIVKNEYSPHSVTKTIAIHKCGGRTVGFMHSDYNHPYVSPSVSTFLYLDYYGIYGDIYKNAYSRFWKDITHIRRIGVLRNDTAFTAMNSGLDNAFCRGLLNQKKEGKIISVFAGALKTDLEDEKRRDFLLQFYKGISRLADEYPEAVIAIKTKSADNVMKEDGFKEMLEPLVRRGRLVFAPQDSTYPLLGISDFVIGWRNTAVCLEAICAGKKAVFFNPMHDYVDPQENFYRGYSPYLMTTNEDELVETVGRYLKGENPVGDDIFNRIRKEHDVAFDGKSTERLLGIVKEALGA